MVSADADSVLCDSCDSECAVVFCRADSARLCLACDREVHAANTVSSRHNRSLLCDSCASAPATIFCPTSPHRLVLCSSCDFNAHQVDDHRHDRRAVDPFTGCPAGAVLAAALGIGDDKATLPNKVEEDWAWEVPLVFSWDDLLLQPTTTSFHGFQAMGIPPPQKDKNTSCGKREEEIHRQFRKLIVNEADGFDCSEENVPVKESKSLLQENPQLGKLDNEYGYLPVFVEVPSCEISKVQCNLTDDQMAVRNPVEVSQEKQIGSSSSAETFADRTIEAASHPCLPKDELFDRSSVILRYKEKRKTRSTVNQADMINSYDTNLERLVLTAG
ncbi:zinc finger protein CONSTANS-LIKE 13-like isoform X2 [Phalaenopsis equestris]|uniref:zinc finger protein CONSTANS-LIKE 13-like isoform X2 n=1 Tax=Phalaenopsis equestris TaxID=78828 RepID=UPI0009E5D002|nr:zinc finger protein CONSTANS-LIKE 13-like isoform X2 [Phalaenopsis equestris]